MKKRDSAECDGMRNARGLAHIFNKHAKCPTNDIKEPPRSKKDGVKDAPRNKKRAKAQRMVATRKKKHP